MVLTSKSEADTYRIAATLGRFLVPGDTVLLYGDLGAGKSVFARGCAKALGVKGEMASPSFTIMQPYEGSACKVYHFDLYRLGGADELYFSGLEEHIGTDGVSLIEWPQQADVCPDRRAEIDIEKTDDPEERRVEINLFGMDARADRIFAALSELG